MELAQVPGMNRRPDARRHTSRLIEARAVENRRWFYSLGL